jgi:hypothetical protein
LRDGVDDLFIGVQFPKCFFYQEAVLLLYLFDGDVEGAVGEDHEFGDVLDGLL